MRNTIRISACLALLGLVAFSTGCNKVENGSQSASYLIVGTMFGSDVNSILQTTGQNFSYSDVVYIPTEGDKPPTVLDDHFSVELTAMPINPDVDVNSMSSYNDVIVDRVDVSYSRTGNPNLNVPGRDVPDPFSQYTNIHIPLGENVTGTLVLVPHVAKLASPLVELTYPDNQEKILKLEATITFNAKDMAGNRLKPVIARMSIWCGNFGND